MQGVPQRNYFQVPNMLNALVFEPRAVASKAVTSPVSPVQGQPRVRMLHHITYHNGVKRARRQTHHFNLDSFASSQPELDRICPISWTVYAVLMDVLWRPQR